jgi:benzoate/toluate 1,2-dioxygenase subunit beta
MERTTNVWESVQAFIGKEAVLLDNRNWDEWLELYLPDCEYWVPAWRSNGTLVSDPKRELSLIYYQNRVGLEARVYRICTGRSASANLAPRIVHVSQLISIANADDGGVRARTNWISNSVLEGRVASYFGHSEYVLQPFEDNWRIRSKKTVIANDVIHEVLDFYNV